MIRRLSVFYILLMLISACKKDEQKAAIPAYLHIDDMNVHSDFQSEGTASDRLTTVFISIDGEDQGAYEIPCDFPIIGNGEHTISIHPGMDLYGIAAYRTVYPFYEVYSEQVTLIPEKTTYLNANNDSIPSVGYKTSADITILEDFEGNGLRFEETPGTSDTIMFITKDSSEIFTFKNEPVEGSGKIYLEPSYQIETSTISSYKLPGFGADVYVEINYKSDIQFSVGIFANRGNQTIASPVATVNPSDEWNKIYINLEPEVSYYYNDADDFDIFIRAVNSSNEDRILYLDNIKLVF